MDNLSVIVITRNRLKKLKRCVGSVRKKLSGAEIIIIVDNNPSDEVRQYLDNNPEILHIYVKESLNVAGARNVGIKNARNDFIMFLDDDAWLEKLDWEEMERYFFEHSEVGIVVPKIFYPDGRLQESIRSFPTIPFVLWRGFGIYKIIPNAPWYRNLIHHNDLEIHLVDWGIGACQIVRKEVFKTVGQLDTKLFAYEDADLCRRARNSGFLTIYWPNARVYHEYSRLSSRGINMRFFRHIKSIFRFFLKSKFH